jgi:acyl-CoA dehydrogenase
MLADMITEIDASRLLVWRAAWLSRNGEYVNAEGSQSKLKAGRTPCGSPSGRSRSWAATATPVSTRWSAWHRDSKIYDIFEGTEQIQQLVIARAISGLRTLRRRGKARFEIEPGPFNVPPDKRDVA